MTTALAAPGTTPESFPDPVIVQDQLLVAKPYFDLVVNALAEKPFFIALESVEHSAILPLSRLCLKSTVDTDPFLVRTPSGPINIGLVLDRLRMRFRADNQGWAPTMGKNRAVFDNVSVGGSMSYGGVGNPKDISAGTISGLQKGWGSRPGAPGKGVTVAIVDTKMTPARELQGSWYASSADTVYGKVTGLRDGHATFVAGMIVSEAPGAIVDVWSVLDSNGKSDSWAAAHAIVRAAGHADILNLSFSCLTGDGEPPLALATAIDLIDPEVVVVAAAGNHGGSNIRTDIDGKTISDISKCAAFPAALDNVIAVGSTNKLDVVSGFSPRGVWVDLQAYGEDVTSTFPEYGGIKNGFAVWSGTSFAAARVSGIIAAQTVPGRITARQAADELLSSAKAAVPGRHRSTPTLPLRPWWGR